MLLGAYQMPLASGQSLAMKAQVSRGETGLSKRKWSCRKKTWKREWRTGSDAEEVVGDPDYCRRQKIGLNSADVSVNASR